MFDREALPRVVPFAAYMAFSVVAMLLERAGLGAEQLRWLYPVKVGTVLAILLWYRRQYVELLSGGLGARAAGWAVVVGVVVLVLWVSLDAGWMQIGTSAGFDPRTNGQVDWLLVACRIAGAALVVPVMEELFWRSFLMRWIEAPAFLALSPRAVGVRGFVVSVLLFGSEHNLWFAGVVAGAAYSWLYIRSQNLWQPILAHAVTNGLLGAWIMFTGQWSYW